MYTHLVRSFFEDHLKVQKGLSPASVRSYADAMRLFLGFVAQDARLKISRLSLEDLSFERAKRFLAHLEAVRKNHPRTRNQRLAAVRGFYEYVAGRAPQVIPTCQQVEGIPVKRAVRREISFLEREEVGGLLENFPRQGRHALRDRTLLLFLYNTGARAEEVAGLRRGQLILQEQPRVHLHGKGDKWRTCPIWAETAKELLELLGGEAGQAENDRPVFCSRPGIRMTRFGIYKVVRRRCSQLDRPGPRPRKVTPHVFRHTAAVHLLEAGVEINVIRAWLGHVSLETTNRYAEITMRMKAEALATCEAPGTDGSEATRRTWKEDDALLAWLSKL